MLVRRKVIPIHPKHNMMIAKKQSQNVGAMPTPEQIDQAKKFNKDLRYCQGFRAQIAANSTTQLTISLNSSGKELLGISVMPVSGNLTDLADTQVKLIVNNNNLLLGASAQNLNPNFVQNMIFFPTPQPLFGNDSIQVEFTKNDAVAKNLVVNFFYVPRV